MLLFCVAIRYADSLMMPNSSLMQWQRAILTYRKELTHERSTASGIR
jgi:hypothetical protein